MALTAAPEEQILLLDLQQHDSKLQQLARRAQQLPEAQTIVELEAQRETLRGTLADQTGVLDDARLELGRIEADVKVVDARIARDTERLNTTSSPKDATALEQELGALATRKSDLEDIELQVMETVEQREAEYGATQGSLAELEEKIGHAVLARDEALARIADETQETKAYRAALVTRIPADLLALYEKQRERYGIGASLLRGGVSTAAGVTLTPTDLAGIRAAAPDAVLLCPDSSAILVRTDESGI